MMFAQHLLFMKRKQRAKVEPLHVSAFCCKNKNGQNPLNRPQLFMCRLLKYFEKKNKLNGK